MKTVIVYPAYSQIELRKRARKVPVVKVERNTEIPVEIKE